MTERRVRGISRPKREPSPELARMIQKRLDQLEMSKSQLAREAGLSQGYVSKLVAGTETPPSEQMVHILAGILELDPDEMMFAARMIPRDLEIQILTRDPVRVRAAIAEMIPAEVQR